MMDDHVARPIEVYTDSQGQAHIRVDAPGERAVSAPVLDAFELVRLIATEADLELEDTVPDQLTISIPPGS